MISKVMIDTDISVQKKPNVLIADLGGGTLDFQCLTVESVNPLKLEETIPGIG